MLELQQKLWKLRITFEETMLDVEQLSQSDPFQLDLISFLRRQKNQNTQEEMKDF